MGKALYRKYRSKKLSEIVGQEHITKTLENALKSGKLSHAYLFTGPRGVGKTSIARILAHEINELPYTDESIHLDIIEIDAASNRRIDEIRDLRDKVHIAPTSAKYKVYIIDEVHMLTKEAFNALLKTLEEPPAHVVFILATTELHKLPDTIISRTQRFTFKSIEQDKAVSHLRTIADSEKISIDDDALKLLADHGHGSFRDSISLLDQVRSTGKKITAEDVQRLVGIAASDHIKQLLAHTSGNGTAADILQDIEQLQASGITPAQIAKQIAAQLRQEIIAGRAHTVTTDLLENLLAVSGSPEPAGALEIALLRAHLHHNPSVQTTAAEPAPAVQPAPEPAAPPVVYKPAEPQPETPAPTPEPEPETDEPAPAVTEAVERVAGELADWWQDVLQHIKPINNTLYGILRMADAKVDGETLHLSFGFGFHKKKVADPAVQTKIHDAIKHITGKSFAINPIHNKNMTKDEQTAAVSAPAAPTPQTPAPQPAKDISSITNIFGGGEVLES